MKIVIAGAGEVGTYLAKMLSNEDQDIIVCDTDERKLVNLENYNLMTFNGSATSFDALKNMSVPNADLFIAVTPYETCNVIACAMAKELGAKRTVARIDNYEFMNTENQEFFKKQGIDYLIYPEHLAAQEIIIALNHTWVRNWYELYNGELIVIGVKLRKNALIVGKRLRELSDISQFMHVSAIKRNRETIIPRGDDMIEENDIAYIATTREHLLKVTEICGKKPVDVERIIIMGGGEIAVQLAMLVNDKYKIKIIESDLERCHELSMLLPQCTIVNGSASDSDVLEEEGVSDYNAFIALTSSSEANILSCLMAKELGVKKTIAEVENIQFIAEAESLNIGTIINKKLLASSRIFQIMLDNDVSDSRSLALADAEVSELKVKEGAKVTKNEVKDLKIGSEMTIAGLVRDGKGLLVNGNTKIQPGDHVVVFCLNGAVHKVEKLFSR
ncbi:MAG: Trk system potassium transporter TrkA [Muribaculaceae bacterium]|nr:Trk system potassium transporter TrkA [Muribaculaceae bacterium]